MFDYQKYEKKFFMPPVVSHDWVKKDAVDKAPIWCSVDLRDGNQALPIPMTLKEKLELYQMLLEIGFKEIEVAFPAASDTDFQFLRTLIEDKMIPEDVTLQVITQAREHIIRRTFQALEGAPKAIVHLYNSTSEAQRRQVFHKSKEEIKKLAVDGAVLLKKLAEKTKGDFYFQYSPESFPGTEVDYALDICNSVLEIWKPTRDHKAIINIPTTVENAMPHIYASQLEYINRNLLDREAVVLSIHPHNDRGCGVCDAEYGILAGAERVEGTLFGNGERTGNVDLITVAMNLYSQGVNPELDFSRMNHISDTYQRLTKMSVPERQPYSGALVFTAFSGSHQDAIAKGMKYRAHEKIEQWDVPYLPVDPADLGRNYETDVIRINSQSGKGGIGSILQNAYGIKMPYEMNEEFGYLVKGISDQENKELSADEIHQIFLQKYVDFFPRFTIETMTVNMEDIPEAILTIMQEKQKIHAAGQGDGSLDAVSNALKTLFSLEYELEVYEEHSMGKNSLALASAYIGISSRGKRYWGAGVNSDIIKASAYALAVAVNKLLGDVRV